MLVNCHADGQTFKFWLRPAQEFQFQFLFFNTRTQSDCACRGNGQACLDRRVFLVSQTVVKSIQLFFFIWSRGPPWVKRHEPNRLAFRQQKLVEASTNSTTINLLKLPKMWRLLMRVEKWLMVFSFVQEPSRRNIQHLKDYPVFKVFFFDFRTLAVSWSTRYAIALKGLPHCDSSDSLRNRNFKSARTPLRTSKSARTVIPTNFYADELL